MSKFKFLLVFFSLFFSSLAFSNFADFRYECRGTHDGILYDFDVRARVFNDGRHQWLNQGDFSVGRERHDGSFEYFVKDGEAVFRGILNRRHRFDFPKSKFGLRYNFNQRSRRGFFEHKLSRYGRWNRIQSECKRFRRDW